MSQCECCALGQVQTKTIAQCVEFYYTWKRRSRAGKRLNVGLTTPMAENEVSWAFTHTSVLRPVPIHFTPVSDPLRPVSMPFHTI